MSTELHGQLLAAETDMNNKNKEIQTLHSSLTEAMVTKERLEQRVVEVMEMSHSMPNDSLEARVQVSQLKNAWKNKTFHVSILGKESSVQSYHLSYALSAFCVSQELMNENKDLQVQNESLQAQISSQVYLLTSFIYV